MDDSMEWDARPSAVDEAPGDGHAGDSNGEDAGKGPGRLTGAAVGGAVSETVAGHGGGTGGGPAFVPLSGWVVREQAPSPGADAGQAIPDGERRTIAVAAICSAAALCAGLVIGLTIGSATSGAVGGEKDARIAELQSMLAEKSGADRDELEDAADRLEQIADELRHPGSDSTGERGRGSGALGISCSDRDGKPGVRVDGFADGAAARDAGMSEGDVIVEMDGEPVGSRDELAAKLGATEPGDTVRLGLDDGRFFDIVVK